MGEFAKNFQLTLYEIFGYLFPGLVAAVGIYILTVSLFASSEPVQVPLPNSYRMAAFLLLAYFAGHGAQACGNLVERYLTPIEKALCGKTKSAMPLEIIRACRERAGALVPGIGENLSPKWLVKLAAAAIEERDKSGSLELFTYREGFYRGCFIAGLIVAASLVSLAIRLKWSAQLSIVIFGHTYAMSLQKTVFALFLSMLSSVLSFQRWRRFSKHRFTHTLLAFAITPMPAALNPPMPNPDTAP
jgi:hypothetical protein